MPDLEAVQDDDIDNMEFDPADFDPNNPFSRDMPVENNIARLRLLSNSEASFGLPSRVTASARPEPPLFPDTPPVPPQPDASSHESIPEYMKSWSVLYPIYFDRARSVREGRRVALDKAVHNPVAIGVMMACRALGYEAAFEVTKCHPQDWANPGRVRVNLKSQRKRRLYNDVANFLQKQKTTKEMVDVSLYRRLTQYDDVRPVAVPRGLKIPEIVPGISPAVSAKEAIKESIKSMGNMFNMRQ